MRLTKGLIILSSIVWAHTTRAQVPIVPDQFRVNLQNQEIEKPVEFYQLNYRTSTIDLRALKTLTDYKFPDSVVINPPSLTSFDHTVALIGFSGPKNNPDIIVWLAGNYNYRNITFFIDYDQDRNFNNDKPPVRVRTGEEPKEIILTPKNGQNRVMYLSAPKVEVKRLERYKVKIVNRPTLSFSAGVGSGDISYQYDDLTIGYPTWYNVKITEKHLSATLAYDFKKFQFGVTGAFQNHFYFTSSLNVQRGEPYTILVNGREQYFDNIERNKNLDKHTPNRFQYSVFASYKLALGNAFDLQPIVRVGKTSYFNPEYNRRTRDDDQVYPLETSPFYEIGVRAEFTVGIEKAFYVEFARNDQVWEPTGFLDDTPHENFSSESVIWKMNVGYRLALNWGR